MIRGTEGSTIALRPMLSISRRSKLPPTSFPGTRAYAYVSTGHTSRTRTSVPGIPHIRVRQYRAYLAYAYVSTGHTSHTRTSVPGIPRA
eukprot:1746520-Rhodomonas_salina.2